MLYRIKVIFDALRRGERRVNCARIAATLEVSARSILRDIEFMRYQLDLPIEYDETRHTFFLTEPVAGFMEVIGREAA